MTLTRYTLRDDRLNNDVIDLERRLLNDPIKMRFQYIKLHQHIKKYCSNPLYELDWYRTPISMEVVASLLLLLCGLFMMSILSWSNNYPKLTVIYTKRRPILY